MLKIVVGGTEVYDEKDETFSIEGGFELELEHSLVALSKWEQLHEKPFLVPDSKTEEEVLSYVRCMTLTANVSGEIYTQLSIANLEAVHDHINAKMTATVFNDSGKVSKSGEFITNELVYYWMTAYHIPFDPCQHWHLNRLFALIRIAGLKQEPPKKMSRQEAARRQQQLNAQRRAQVGTKG